MKLVKTQVRKEVSSRAQATSLLLGLDPESRRVLELAAEKGASSWLTTKPLKHYWLANYQAFETLFTKVHSEMPSIYVMVGHLPDCQQHVPVVSLSLCRTQCPVHSEDILHLGTMSSET